MLIVHGMRKEDVIGHYGTATAVAEALKISVAAVSQWDEIIPVMSAHRLSELTGGTLRFDARLYRHSSARVRQIANALSA